METGHAVSLYAAELTADVFRKWSGKQDGGIECLKQDVLAQWRREVERRTDPSNADSRGPISDEGKTSVMPAAGAPGSAIVMIVGKTAQVQTISSGPRLIREFHSHDDFRVFLH